MTMKLRWATLFVFMLLGMAAVRTMADDPAAGDKPPTAPAAANNTPPVLMTISKETTRITGPLHKDGYVDYVAALNELGSKGVTPTNNAAALIWRAFGPEEIDKSERSEFFKLLGVAPLPRDGDYFIPLDQYAPRQGTPIKNGGDLSRGNQPGVTHDPVYVAGERPWSAAEFPTLAHWLKANEKPLAVMVEASKRPRRYDPLIESSDQTLIEVLLPALHLYREAAFTLAARAALRINEGKTDAAWDDLMAIHRLARLAAQGPTLVDAMVADAIEAVACGGDQVLLQHSRLSAATATKMLSDLRKLPPLSNMADKIDLNERFMFLDAVGFVARNGIGDFMKAVNLISQLSTGNADSNQNSTNHNEIKNIAPQPPDRARLARIDWNLILRMGNTWYDRMVEALRKPTRAERKRAIDKIQTDLRALAAKAGDFKSFVASPPTGSQAAVSLRLGELLVSLLLPGIGSASNAEDRTAMQFDLTKMGFALAAYYADRGSYPERLTMLTPKYIAAIPRDIFTNGELRYKQSANGYLLYSVGVNGVDDNGNGTTDCRNGESWDDLSVRVSSLAPKKP